MLGRDAWALECSATFAAGCQAPRVARPTRTRNRKQADPQGMPRDRRADGPSRRGCGYGPSDAVARAIRSNRSAYASSTSAAMSICVWALAHSPSSIASRTPGSVLTP